MFQKIFHIIYHIVKILARGLNICKGSGCKEDIDGSDGSQEKEGE